uniref:Uncharacterized protein n=1 Tax=Caenorhabditis japonica TaxID=281687 RepID=A0A8R1E8D8_CAEJA
MEQMQTYFKRSIAVIRRSEEEFTGAEAADVLTAYIQSHKNDFPRQSEHSPIFPQFFSGFVNRKKTETNQTFFYRLYVVNTPASSRAYDEATVTRSASSRRSNSFKRLFSPLVRRNRSNSRGREKDGTKDTSTILKSTWSLFSSSDKQEKKARRAEQQLIKEEEEEVYELALFHLLGMIEVEFLEDVALPVQDSKKNVSFLTSIREKVGLGAGEDRLDPQQEEDMDLLIETHPLIRDASQWFQLARCCAPMLYLQTTPGKSQKMQLFMWCKDALEAVSARLAKMTHNGASPLFPVEFAPLLAEISKQLINDLNSGEKLSVAVMYLFLMVPNPLRKTIDQIVHWLQLTMRTEAVEDLRSPYYLGRKEPRHKENVKVIIDEMRSFFFPKGCMTIAQQDIFMETLVELRMSGRLGQRPEQLEKSLRAKHSADGDLTPSCLDDKKISLTDKKKQLANFNKCYPELYKRFFNKML